MNPPVPTQPLAEDRIDGCPHCGADLEFCVGWNEEQSYEGVRCANGCNLEEA